MRAAVRLLPVLGAAVGLACGGSHDLTAPPPSELAMAVTVNPDATGGMRPSTTVSALLVERGVVSGVLQTADFAVFDAQGRVLARQSVPGPLTFGPDGTMTVRQVLDWTPSDVLGRSLKVLFVLRQPGASPVAIERTVTF